MNRVDGIAKRLQVIADEAAKLAVIINHQHAPG
jgi:hypothetical protein